MKQEQPTTMSECESCKTATSDLTDGLCENCEEASLPSSQSGDKTTPCPCGAGPTNKKNLMQCAECKMWWHPACVGLDGLSIYITKKIVSYKCPMCFTLSPEIKESLGIENEDAGGTETVKATVRREIKEVMPKVIEELVSVVKSALGENTMQKLVKDANEKISKSWADIAKTEQNRVIKDVVGKTSEIAMKESLSKISADLSEQKTRQRNVIMSNVSEGYGGTDSSLADVVCNFAGHDLSHEEIAYCKRLGEKRAGVNRLILIVLKKEDCAAELHNFGRGRNLGNGLWINPDLTRTEREAKYIEREKRRERKNRPDDRPPVREAARDARPPDSDADRGVRPPVRESAQTEIHVNGPADTTNERRHSTRGLNRD